MRITCDVETVNRLCATLNMQGKGKTVRAHVSVGRKPALTGSKSQVYLMICTKQDRNGTKYKLRGNIEHMFAKFVSEGKATLRFTQPPVDLCLSKADPIQLKGFLSVVRLGHQGDNLDKVFLTFLSPASSKSVEQLTKKLVVKRRKDYPLVEGFPRGLETLQVNGCCMKRVDTRILQLRHIRVLNLNANRLTSLPSDWSALNGLVELHLSDNMLTALPEQLCTGSVSGTLSMLDLSGNSLKALRPWFCSLRALVTLKLNHNGLEALPATIGNMVALRYVSATHNSLRVLPESFGALRLQELDLFANLFLLDGPSTTIDRLIEDGGLLELSARAVKKHRLHYSRETVPGDLYDMLESAKACLCGATCFRSFVHYLRHLDLHSVSASLSAIDVTGRTHAPCEAFLCSRKCLDRYQKNPQASMWK